MRITPPGARRGAAASSATPDTARGENPVNEREQETLRTRILDRIREGVKIPEIAAQIGVREIVVKKEIRGMRYEHSSGLHEAQEAAFRKASSIHGEAAQAIGDRFKMMTGMTFQEKTYQNMIEFYKPELQRILNARDQSTEIMKLPKSVLKTLRSNGIIIHERSTSAIASRARGILA